jgi:hypothetical protein
MLTPDDRNAIEGLFDRLRNVEMQADPPDREANEMIRRAIERQPDAPYYMAQTIVVEEQALEQAQRRIVELESALERARSGDAFGEARSRGPWNRGNQNDEQRESRWGGRGPGGGGFLAGAMQTALGVTGGLLLGSALGGLFGAGEANAEEAGQDETETETQVDDNSQDTDVGDDFGGDSGFDVGGDF